MPELLQLTLIALFASIVPLIGGIIFLYWNPFSKTIERFAIPFAAGALITVGLVGLLPEAIHLLGTKALWGVLAAFFVSFLFERLFFSFHHHDHHGSEGSHSKKHHTTEHKASSAAQSSVGLVVLGDTIHNVIDGIAIGGAFLVNPGLAFITALSTFLHELPHEIGDFGILLKAGWEKKKIVLINVLSASAAILGAFSVQFFAVNTSIIGWLLAVSAGIFIYLGSVDFLPHTFDHGGKNWPNMAALMLGVVVLSIAFNLIPHSHEELGDDHGHDDTEVHQEGDDHGLEDDHSEEDEHGAEDDYGVEDSHQDEVEDHADEASNQERNVERDVHDGEDEEYTSDAL